MSSSVNIFWFRRDLRLYDNAGLYHALKAGLPVLPVFIFDRNILDDLEDKADRRVQFIFNAVQTLQKLLISHGSSLSVFYGYPLDIFRDLQARYSVCAVYANEDYEAYARARDAGVAGILKKEGSNLLTFKDQVIFSKNEVVKDNGEPYTVFTPYAKKWKNLLTNFFLKSYPGEPYYRNFLQQPEKPVPSLKEMGFDEVKEKFPPARVSNDLFSGYAATRDYPGISGTSRMGVHLRFGTVSIRELARKTKKLSDVYLGELIWREFYQMILWHFPHVGQGRAFKQEYDKIVWRNNDKDFARWCNGQTGYPLVDAGMRQLNETGFMHNRVRMVTASFLAKHLLIDWRWGEAYFAAKLLDFDFASNNGGWQWAAGTGCDAAPYFRIFNPWLQAKRFDKNGEYIRKWVPEVDTPDYPDPVVDHQFARERCLEAYRKALAR